MAASRDSSAAGCLALFFTTACVVQVVHREQVEEKRSVMQEATAVDDMYDMLAVYEQKVPTAAQVSPANAPKLHCRRMDPFPRARPRCSWSWQCPALNTCRLQLCTWSCDVLHFGLRLDQSTAHGSDRPSQVYSPRCQ